MNHFRWIILAAVGFVCVAGCERPTERGDDYDRTTQAPVTPRRDMPQADQRADMPRPDQRAQMPQQQPQQQAGRPANAVQAISTARCEREQRCGNIGADQNFSSADDCMAQIRRDWAGELSAYECPGGIAQDELSECLVEIRNEDCGNPFDTLGRVAACRSSDICQA